MCLIIPHFDHWDKNFSLSPLLVTVQREISHFPNSWHVLLRNSGRWSAQQLTWIKKQHKNEEDYSACTSEDKNARLHRAVQPDAGSVSALSWSLWGGRTEIWQVESCLFSFLTPFNNYKFRVCACVCVYTVIQLDFHWTCTCGNPPADAWQHIINARNKNCSTSFYQPLFAFIDLLASHKDNNPILCKFLCQYS